MDRRLHPMSPSWSPPLRALVPPCPLQRPLVVPRQLSVAAVLAPPLPPLPLSMAAVLEASPCAPPWVEVAAVEVRAVLLALAAAALALLALPALAALAAVDALAMKR